MPGELTTGVDAVDTVRDVDRAAWNALVPNQHISLTHEWLLSLEDAPIRRRYFLATVGGRLAGALPAYLWDGIAFVGSQYDPVEVAAGGPGAPQRGRSAWFPTLLLGARNGSTTQILLDGDRAGLLPSLVDAAHAWGAGEGARSTAFLHLDPPSCAAVEQLGLPGATTLPLPPETQLRLPAGWTTFDDYVGSLPRNRRTTVRRERREFREAGLEVVRAELSEHCDVLGPLLGNVQRKHGLPMSDAVCTAHLREKAAYLDDRSTVFLCRRGDLVAGFSLFHRHGALAFSGAAGFDYALTRELPFVYFNTLFYEPIAWAIESGLRGIYFGREAYASKLARGADLSERWGVVVPPA